jgi:hypothetical protein
MRSQDRVVTSERDDRAPGASPVIAATRSDCSPAQAMTLEASTGPRVVSSATSRGPGRIAVTRRPSAIFAPSVRISSA